MAFGRFGTTRTPAPASAGAGFLVARSAAIQLDRYAGLFLAFLNLNGITLAAGSRRGSDGGDPVFSWRQIAERELALVVRFGFLRFAAFEIGERDGDARLGVFAFDNLAGDACLTRCARLGGRSNLYGD